MQEPLTLNLPSTNPLTSHLVTSILNQPPVKPVVQLKERIRYFVISDIHLGCKRNLPREMIKGLSAIFDNFKEDAKLKDIDILFIAGDLFDQALWFSNEDVTLILLFIRELMEWCERNGIKLRVLEGTPSHDRNQPRNLIPIAQSFKALDFRYVEVMCVEAFYDLGITCLYVPDEFGGSAENAQRLIKEELDNLCLGQVDIAIMHGMCRYQVPEITSDRYKYNEEFLLSIVRAFINIGHVHLFSTYDRILCQGSFDRISHGEEGPKGGILVELCVKTGNKFFFIQNKLSKLFKTIHVKTKDLEKACRLVKTTADQLPDFSHLRIKASKLNPVLNVFDQLASGYPCLFFTKITEEEEEEKNQLVNAQDLLDVKYTPIHINKENITSMLMDEINQRQELHPSIKEKLEARLKELS